MRDVRPFTTLLRVSAFCAACFFVSESVLGQDIGALRGQLADSTSIASDMVRRCDLVADGEFYALPEYSDEELRALVIEDVVIKFRAHKLYKGPQRDPIDIRVTNQTLEYPGEGISRFVKRERILEKQWKDLEPLFEQFHDARSLYEAGTMSESEFMAEADEIAKLMTERQKVDGLADNSPVFATITHGKTFYEHGGAIAPGRNYLICVNQLPDEKGIYTLKDLSGRWNISWGERRDYVLSGFDRQAELGSGPR